MENIYNKRNILHGILWKFMERGLSILVTFAVNIMLARLLDPKVFGLAAMITVFVTLSNIFVTSGLGNALIQKKNADELDFSTMFWMNMGVSVLIYLILFLIAPIIADFYGYSVLTPMLRILSIQILIAALNSIQCAYISRNMMFRYYFYSTLSGKIASGFIGIVMALLGLGVWALIGQSLSLILLETLILWFKVRWRPKKVFSWSRAKSLYAFSWKIMLTSFIEAIRDQLRNLLIGKKYSSSDLAYYDKGQLFPNSIITNISSSLGTVMFPVISNAQYEKNRPLTLCRRWISMFAYGGFPILTGLIVVANPFISVILTEKWLPAEFFLQCSCCIYAAWIVEVPIRETLKSLGYAGICLKIQIIKTVLAITVLIIVADFGVKVIAISMVVCAFINILISVFYGNKYIKYTPKLIYEDIGNTLLINIIMGIIIYLLNFFDLSSFICLIMQIILGVIIYILLSYMFQNKNFKIAIEFLKEIVKK